MSIADSTDKVIEDAIFESLKKKFSLETDPVAQRRIL